MAVTARDLDILRLLRRYYYLRTAQIRDVVAPHDDEGSITRGRLRKLQEAGYIRRHQPKMTDGLSATAPPIFILTIKGSAVLATETGDCSQILTVEPTFRDWMSLNHYCALSSLHITIDAAFALQSYVKMHALYFEHEVVDAKATEPSKRFRLHTTVSAAPLVFCCPDTAFETEVNGYRRAYYVEREMGSDTPARVAAKKHKGYAGLHAFELFRKNHFPLARDFRVLAFCPNASWRDALLRELKGKSGAELWQVAAMPDVNEHTFLHGNLFHTVTEGAKALVKAPAGSPVPEGKAE